MNRTKCFGNIPFLNCLFKAEQGIMNAETKEGEDHEDICHSLILYHRPCPTIWLDLDWSLKNVKLLSKNPPVLNLP